MSKCKAYCDHYDVYKCGEGFKTICNIKGLEIKEIKEKFPDIYNNCEKYCKSKKYYKQQIKNED